MKSAILALTASPMVITLVDKSGGGDRAPAGNWLAFVQSLMAYTLICQISACQQDEAKGSNLRSCVVDYGGIR